MVTKVTTLRPVIRKTSRAPWGARIEDQSKCFHCSAIDVPLLFSVFSFGERPKQFALVEDVAKIMDEMLGLGGAAQFHDPPLPLDEACRFCPQPLEFGAEMLGFRCRYRPGVGTG